MRGFLVSCLLWVFVALLSFSVVNAQNCTEPIYYDISFTCNGEYYGLCEFSIDDNILQQYSFIAVKKITFRNLLYHIDNHNNFMSISIKSAGKTSKHSVFITPGYYDEKSLETELNNEMKTVTSNYRSSLQFSYIPRLKRFQLKIVMSDIPIAVTLENSPMWTLLGFVTPKKIEKNNSVLIAPNVLNLYFSRDSMFLMSTAVAPKWQQKTKLRTILREYSEFGLLHSIHLNAPANEIQTDEPKNLLWQPLLKLDEFVIGLFVEYDEEKWDIAEIPCVTPNDDSICALSFTVELLLK